MHELRVLILADDPLTSAGLAALLAEDPDYRIVGKQKTADDWVEAVERLNPDLLIWDVSWEAGEALEEVIGLTQSLPPLLALVQDPGEVGRLWAGGVQGVLPRGVDVGALKAALRGLAEGLTVFDPDLLRGLVPPRTEAPEEPDSPLTARETEVLRLLADGLSNRGIANELQISEHTVKFHVNSIMSKLNAESRTEAVVSGMRRGIISL
jgi:DNA-binding NarL/FixJ family response regulator